METTTQPVPQDWSQLADNITTVLPTLDPGAFLTLQPTNVRLWLQLCVSAEGDLQLRTNAPVEGYQTDEDGVKFADLAWPATRAQIHELATRACSALQLEASSPADVTYYCFVTGPWVPDEDAQDGSGRWAPDQPDVLLPQLGLVHRSEDEVRAAETALAQANEPAADEAPAATEQEAPQAALPEPVKADCDPLNPPPAPQDWAQIKDQVLHYLGSGTTVMAARGRGNDALDPSRQRVVPLIWYTDGTWIWPGAASYYAQTHDIAPRPEFIDHMRANNFQVPPVDDQAPYRAFDVLRAQG